MAILTVQEIGRSGLNPSFQAAAGGGDSVPNDGRTYAEVVNGGGGAINVTVVTQLTVDGKAVGDDVVNVPAGQRRKVGPWPPSLYNDVNGRAQLQYDGVTSVTVGAFRLP